MSAKTMGCKGLDTLNLFFTVLDTLNCFLYYYFVFTLLLIQEITLDRFLFLPAHPV